MTKKINIDWGIGSFLITYHLILIVGLPLYLIYTLPSVALLLFTAISTVVIGVGITAGYHRLYSHRAFKAHPLASGTLLLIGTLAGQGSVLRWSYDHRIHHAHVDTDQDPYSIRKGFWYAHVLWLFVKQPPIEPKVIADLMKDRLLRFQDRYYPYIFVGTNLLFFLISGWLLHDFFGAFMIGLVLRIFVSHHTTWFINSLAHTWGDKPFCQEQTAVNNFVLAILTSGEGYHNYHHTYANDYRNGIKWYHYDPTKWLIWTLSKLGLASNLKRMHHTVIERRLITERKNLLIQRIGEFWSHAKEELEKGVHDLSEQLLANLATFNDLKQEYQQAKKERIERNLLVRLRSELTVFKKALQRDWKLWTGLSNHILRMQPLASVAT